MVKSKPTIDKAEKLLAKATKKPANKVVAKRKNNQPPRIDWIAAQQMYLMEPLFSYKDIAEKFKVSSSAVEKRAITMGWAELRSKLGEKATNEMVKRLAKKKVSANDRHVNNYKVLQDKIMLAIAELSAESDSGDMLSLAKALKAASDGERVALGLPTMVNAISDTDGRDFSRAFADAWINAGKVLNGEGGTRRG